jgi:sugar (pentulose or hexulose) kinase
VVTAVCESVAYAARHCIEAAGLKGELSVCGGGVASRTWCQIIADVLQIPLRIAPRPEVGARGAAIAALMAIGSDFDYQAWTAPEGTIEPRTEVADRYEAGFAYYIRRVESARELWHSAPGLKATQ